MDFFIIISELFSQPNLDLLLLREGRLTAGYRIDELFCCCANDQHLIKWLAVRDVQRKSDT